MSETTKRWLTEPLFAGILGFGAWCFLAVSYYLRLVSSGGNPPGGLWPDNATPQQTLLGAAPILMLAAWVTVTIVLNRVFRAGDLSRRLLMSFLSAVIVTTPFAAIHTLQLAANDGWRGLELVGLLVLLGLPALAVVLHLVALPAVVLLTRQRRAVSVH